MNSVEPDDAGDPPIISDYISVLPSSPRGSFSSALVVPKRPSAFPKKTPEIYVAKAEYKIDFNHDSGNSRLNVELVGNAEVLEAILTEVRKRGAAIFKHVQHQDCIQCPVCLADAMGKKQDENPDAGRTVTDLR